MKSLQLETAARWSSAEQIRSIPRRDDPPRRDQLCRVEHGRWLAGHIQGARGHILPGHGHTSVTTPFDEVLDELAQTSP